MALERDELRGHDEPSRVAAIAELGRRCAGVALADQLALRELLEADGGAGAAELRDALDAGRLRLALALPPVPGQPPGRVTVLDEHPPGAVAVPRGVPGFGGEGARFAVDVFAVHAPGAELRERGGELAGRAWEVGLAGAAPWATADAGPAGRALLCRAHVRHAAYLSGVADSLIDATRERVTRRRQFGVAISEFQAVAFQLAAHAARWRAVTAHVEELAAQAGAESAGAAARLAASAGDVALATASDLLVLHGAHGLTGASPAQRAYRDAGQHAYRWGLPGELRRYARSLAYR